MWGLNDKLDYILFQEDINVEPFKRGQEVGTKIDGEEKFGIFLGMSESGKARVESDGVIYQVDPKILYIPAEERKREKRRVRDKEKRKKSKIDKNQLDEVEAYFRQRAIDPSSTLYEQKYAEKMLERFEQGINKNIIKKLIEQGEKSIERYNKRENIDKRASLRKYALKRALFQLNRLI